jgi:uncharacterized peroxidase-related enzyme
VFDYRQASLSPPDRALCDYAIKLTLAPGQMVSNDVERLCQAGFTDDQITVAAQVIAYFNYITRIAQGLGVDHEIWMSVPFEEWVAQKGRNYLDSLPP